MRTLSAISSRDMGLRHTEHWAGTHAGAPHQATRHTASPPPHQVWRHTESHAPHRKQCEKPQAMRHTASNAPHHTHCATPWCHVIHSYAPHRTLCATPGVEQATRRHTLQRADTHCNAQTHFVTSRATRRHTFSEATPEEQREASTSQREASTSQATGGKHEAHNAQAHILSSVPQATLRHALSEATPVGAA